jgi:hypothetical protein
VPAYGLVDADYALRMREAASRADAGHIYMLSLAKFRPDSGQRLGRDSGRDPDGRYIPIPLLTSAGAALCFVADVVAGPADWDRVGVIRYPSRRSFVEMSDRRDTRDWNGRKERRMARMTLLGMIPISDLPAANGQRVLLEIWNGPEPAPVTEGKASSFDVEGTYIGDGRRWSAVRCTAIEPGTALPLLSAKFGYQALLLEPIIERWR